MTTAGWINTNREYQERLDIGLWGRRVWFRQWMSAKKARQYNENGDRFIDVKN